MSYEQYVEHLRNQGLCLHVAKLHADRKYGRKA